MGCLVVKFVVINLDNLPIADLKTMFPEKSLSILLQATTHPPPPPPIKAHDHKATGKWYNTVPTMQ